MTGRLQQRYRTALVLALALVLVAAFSLPALAADAKYAGSKQSDVYHHLSCRSVKRITPANLRTFESVAEAKRAGYRACKVCKPPTTD